MQALTLASVAGAFPGFARWSYALREEGVPAVAQPIYQPRFFSPGEYRTLELLVEMILPAVHAPGHPPQPGAREAGVAEFIDFMVASDPAQQSPFADGLAWLKRDAGGDFAGLSPAAQQATLERLAYKAKQRPQDAPGQSFFLLMRRYTVMGFYTTRVGLESLDYPGLKFYTTSPGCPHPDNPEHVGLLS